MSRRDPNALQGSIRAGDVGVVTVFIPAKSQQKARKAALDSENAHAQAYPMITDENQFSSPRDSVKGNSYHWLDTADR
jgi:hypothetical protein